MRFQYTKAVLECTPSHAQLELVVLLCRLLRVVQPSRLLVQPGPLVQDPFGRAQLGLFRLRVVTLHVIIIIMCTVSSAS